MVTIAPWTMYEVYGDRRILSQLYPAMKKYVNYVQQSAGDNCLWEGGSVFGDWLFYKPELKFWTEPDGHTDPDLIATAFYAYSVSILANTAEILGENEEAIFKLALLKIRKSNYEETEKLIKNFKNVCNKMCQQTSDLQKKLDAVLKK